MKQLGFQVKPKLFYCKLTNSKAFPWYSVWLDKDNQEHAQNNIRNLNKILEKYTVKVS